MEDKIEETKTEEREVEAGEHGGHPHDQHSNRWSKQALITVAGLLLLGVIAAAVLWARSGGNQSATSRAQAQDSAAAPTAPADCANVSEEQMRQVTVEPAVERALNVERETTGRVGFNEDRLTPVFTNCEGHVVELLVKKGDVVKVGEPLLVIESPDLIQAENDLAAARAAESQAATVQDTARNTLQRARSLHEREAISTKEVQQAEADYAHARDEQHRARASVRFNENRLTLYGKTPEEIEQLSDLGRKYVGKLDSQAVIRSPISGTIVERKVGPGQYVKAGSSEALFLISDLSNLWVLADVYESYMANIRVGVPVTISVAAYPDRVFPARVSFINPTLDATTRTVHVRCEVGSHGGLIKPEMFAKITIGAAVPRRVPAVPAGAIISQGTDSFVLVEETPRRFRRRQVKTGQDLQGYTVIESGLRVGERVATSGVLLVNGLIESGGGKD